MSAQHNYAEKCTAVNCLCLFEVTFYAHISRGFVGHYSAQVGEKKTKHVSQGHSILYSLLCLCAWQCQRAGTGQVGAGVWTKGVMASFKSLHSSPVVPLTPWLLSFHPARFLPSSPSFLLSRWRGEWQCGGPGDTSHDSSCQSLLSVSQDDWPSPTPIQGLFILRDSPSVTLA